MDKHLEVLVHAGAPSTSKDDARYKAQALAYLDFEAGDGARPRGTQAERSLSAIACDQAANADEDLVRSLERVRSDLTVAPNVSRMDITPLPLPNTLAYLDDTQLGYTALESQLLTSSLITPGRNILKRAASSPSEHPNRNRQHETSQEQTSPEVQTPSSYLRTPVFDRTAKKPRLLDRLRDEQTDSAKSGHVESPTRRSIRSTASPAASENSLGIIGGQVVHPLPQTTEADNHECTMETTSELPTTYSLSNISTRSPRSLLRSQQRSISDPSALLSPRKVRHSQLSSTSLSQPLPNQAIPRAEPSAAPLLTGSKAAPGITAQVSPIAAHGNDQSTTEVANDQRMVEPRKNHVQPVKAQVPPPRAPDVLKETAVRPLPAAFLARKQTPIDTASNCQGAKSQQPTVSLAKAPVPRPSHLEPQTPVPDVSAPMLFIRAPSPPVSITDFTTHITTGLAFLADKSEIAARYIPISTTRPIEPLERGHWIVNTTGWTDEVRTQSWRFLEHFVGHSQAGWGVWCAREGDSVFRVYCWGEVVQHVYLVLYVASKSKVRKAGLQWVDASGKIVVQMP